MMLTSRSFMIGAAALMNLAAATSSPAADGIVRIGYQKYGNLLLLKARGILEERLRPLGIRPERREFPGGPQLLEVLGR